MKEACRGLHEACPYRWIVVWGIISFQNIH